MKVQMNWKNPKELPEVDTSGASPCLLLTVAGARYPVKVWYDGSEFYTPNGDTIYKDYVMAWDWHPENFTGKF